MKFVTLAVALLCAVGCQAASLQADAPVRLATYLDNGRAVARMSLGNAKNALLGIAEKINDEETKNMLKTKINEFASQLESAQEQAAPVTDSVVETIEEATRELRQNIHNDITQMKADLEPQRAALEEVIMKHLNQYKASIEPVMAEYQQKQEEQMKELRPKIEEMLADIKSKIPNNFEETKTKLMPIIDTIRARASDRLENVKQMAAPYVEEYKDQVKAAYGRVQEVNTDVMREKMLAHATKLKENFLNIINDLKGLMAN